jgi:hypothetical protein
MPKTDTPEAELADSDGARHVWGSLPFDKEIVLNAVPRGARTSALHISVSPTPAHGAVRVSGRMRDGAAASVTLTGGDQAAKLPFTDRTIRIQYLGDTNDVQVRLESYALA